MNDNTDSEKVDAPVTEHTVIPVMEEKLLLDKRTIDTAHIRIIKKVEEQTVDVPLVSRKHGYHIERKVLNQYVEDHPPALRYEGNTMVISVLEEEVILVKKLKLVEEIRLTPFEEETERNAQVPLRKERVIIEKTPEDDQ